MMTEIRQCTLEDLPYLYDICFRTGFNGENVEGKTGDLYKIGHYFAAPYLHYNQGYCFVATINRIPKAYVVGTDDTEKYSQWLNTHWLPKVRKYYDFETLNPLNDFDQFLTDVIREETVPDQRLRDYKAHLHIDLLPELQGRGIGKKLIETFFETCRTRGVEKVHLVVSKENPRACSFYKKIGMHEVYSDDFSIGMGRDLKS
jgi:ribosomal protein S18 acetylase RimI-like enzyme